MVDDHTSRSEQSKDLWDKAQIVFGIMGAIAVPLITLGIGLAISASLKNQETSTKLIEVAIKILEPRPVDKEGYLRRSWALGIIDKYSEVKMSKELKDALLSSKSIFEESYRETYNVEAICPNMPVVIIFEDVVYTAAENVAPSRFGELRLGVDHQICYVLPEDVEDSDLTAMRENIRTASERPDFSRSDVGKFRLYKPCRSYEFYLYLGGYTDALGEERRGPAGEMFIVNIRLV